MNGRRITTALVAPLLAVTGCSASLHIGAPPGRGPSCPVAGDWASDQDVPPIVLMAQAVPTASWLPCITALPAGVTFESVDTRSGRGRIWLDSGHEGRHAIRVTLTRRCDTAQGGAVPGPQPGIARYVHAERTGTKYHGEWDHVFPGGCVNYHFDLPAKTGEASIASIAAGLGFVRRDAVAQWVSENSDGRLDLDPSDDQDGAP